MLRERKSVFEIVLLSLRLFAGSPAPWYAQRIESDTFGSLRHCYIGPVGNRVSAVAGEQRLSRDLPAFSNMLKEKKIQNVIARVP